jgi:hypothetical protein
MAQPIPLQTVCREVWSATDARFMPYAVGRRPPMTHMPIPPHVAAPRTIPEDRHNDHKGLIHRPIGEAPGDE